MCPMWTGKETRGVGCIGIHYNPITLKWTCLLCTHTECGLKQCERVEYNKIRRIEKQNIMISKNKIKLIKRCASASMCEGTEMWTLLRKGAVWSQLNDVP